MGILEGKVLSNYPVSEFRYLGRQVTVGARDRLRVYPGLLEGDDDVGVPHLVEPVAGGPHVLVCVRAPVEVGVGVPVAADPADVPLLAAGVARLDGAIQDASAAPSEGKESRAHPLVHAKKKY